MTSSTPRPSSPRQIAARVCPDGLLWLNPDGAAHPEARRCARLPFVFALGRTATSSGTRRASELELAIAAALDSGIDTADDAALLAWLDDYARQVLAAAPTIHARITGRSLTALARSAG